MTVVWQVAPPLRWIHRTLAKGISVVLVASVDSSPSGVLDPAFAQERRNQSARYFREHR